MPPTASPLEQVRPTTRYRYGHRAPHDPEALAAHNAETREWRRHLADCEQPPAVRARFLEELRRGGTVEEAATAVGTTAQRIWGRASWDTAFADELDAVLTDTCPATEHGTWRGAKREHGHCAPCRTARARSRGPRTGPGRGVGRWPVFRPTRT